MPNEKLAELVEVMEGIAKIKKYNRMHAFTPYPKQRIFFEAGAQYRERLFRAGNQVGKTMGGSFEAACHATGDYPDWWKGKKFDRPNKGWCCGIKAKDVRDGPQKLLCGEPGVEIEFGTGMIPKSRIIKKSLSRGVTDAYDTLQITHKTNGREDGVSTITFKSYEEGREGFQGITLDWAWCDEEGPMEVYSEILTRLRGDGIAYTTFTPLLGKTELVDRFEADSADRVAINMTIEEAEHWTKEEKEKRMSGYSSYERDCRAYGIPMMGHGRVFPFDTEILIEDALTYIPPHWFALWGIDFGIGHPFAAALILWDKDNDVIHVHHAIRMSGKDALSLPLHHAAAMKTIGANVPVAWPQDGTARDKGSGIPIAQIYKECGLVMLPEHATFEKGGNQTEAGILEMEQRMTTGRFKVARHLGDWFEEYRGYHRKDAMIVKERDDLMSATRVAVMAKRFARRTVLGSLVKNRRRYGGIAEGVDFDLS